MPPVPLLPVRVTPESLRALLHARQGGPLSAAGGACTAALHVLRCGDGTSLLDASAGFPEAGAADGEFGMMQQCVRFIDSQMEFGVSQLGALLRGLQDNECVARRAFFEAVCASRRRVQHGWATRSVARVFSLVHELCILRHFAMMTRVRVLLSQRGLGVFDAFRAFNASQNGLLSCSELYGALTWLGMRASPADVHEMVRHMDKDSDGLVSYDEFRKALNNTAFGNEAADEALADDAEVTDDVGERLEFSGLSPIPILELADADEQQHASSAQAAPLVPPEVLARIKVKIQKLEKFDEVWRSAGIASKHKTSIWDDRLRAGGKLGVSRNRLRVNLGHYASASYAAPRGDRYTIELTDLSVGAMTASKWLPLVIPQLFPHPQRFKQVWSIQTGSEPLFIWRPVPPSDEYVALGMVATKVEDPPPSCKSVHCVPASWVEAEPDMMKMLWSDEGASGKPGSLWAAGSLQLLVAAQGHSAPGDCSFKMRRTRFTLGEPGQGEILEFSQYASSRPTDTARSTDTARYTEMPEPASERPRFSNRTIGESVSEDI